MPGTVAVARQPAGKTTLYIGLVVSLTAALWFASRHSLLLFHSIAEVFSIGIAACVFALSWTSRSYEVARPFVPLGIGYLFVALIDLFHVMSYEGMNVFAQGLGYSTRLWVAARFLQALVALWFTIDLRLRRHTPAIVGFALIGGAATALLFSIFWWGVFPICLIQGQGVTAFMVASEITISVVLAVSILLVARDGVVLHRPERLLLMACFASNIASELVTTLDWSASGYPDIFGHYLKILSYFLAYRALFTTQVRERIALIGELVSSKAALEQRERDLEKANQSKDKFFSIIAHDLRNPIGGLLNISELLAKRFDELGTPKVRDLSQRVYETSHHVTELLESILHWARAHTRKLEARPSTVRMAELCEGIAEQQRSAARNKSIRVSCRVDDDQLAYADEQMLATVLRNLLSNAIKFTPHGGEVTISSEGAGDWQLTSVADSGVGMSPDEVAKLFQIDAHFSSKGTDAEPGHGLGLILCKELMDMNRGSISVRSEIGKGSVFTVQVPRWASIASEAKGRSASPSVS